jgi:hypothetical protein
MKRESKNSFRKPEKSPLSVGKHVIVLGAGASASSGYPVGEGLRKLLANPERLCAKVKEQLKEKNEEIEGGLDYSLKTLDRSIRLFRNGGFATVDEFVRLAGQHRETEAEYLRRLLSLCFAIENPEASFEQSDYYPFVQRLFEGDLMSLRADLSVLTFNYDSYLEFLLRRAYETRCEAKGMAPSDVVLDAILSGFRSRLTQKLAEPGGFCLLKLHGTCALPSCDERDEPCPTHDELFNPDPARRFHTVSSRRFADVGFSPIFFPWEILNRSGSFVSKEKFRWAKQRQTGSEIELFSLFKAIWERARKEVRGAARLSFVGLSMHNYLEPGFRFLLKGKGGHAELVIADKEPQKPAERLERWLKGSCPDLQWKVRVRTSFAEFIQEEMEPLNVHSEPNGSPSP